MQVMGATFVFSVMTHADISQEELAAEAEKIDEIFIDRDAEFEHSADIIDEYPSTWDPKTSRFLLDPADHIAGRIAEIEIEQQVVIKRIVVLTTHGQHLLEPLSSVGYTSNQIDMPAWSATLHAFTLDRSLSTGPAVTLFFDAVDFACGRRKPTFVIKLLDSYGEICGGASGTIRERGGQQFAYIATFTLKAGLPPTTGTRFAEAMISFLRQKGVISVDLITQTAGRFYQKFGFQITHRVVEGFRTRIGSDGQCRSEDLMILNMKLISR